MKFFKLLERGKKLVLEQVITTIASVADAAQDQFVAFYDRFSFVKTNSLKKNLLISLNVDSSFVMFS